MATLELEGISKVYSSKQGPVRAVSGLDIHVPDRDMLVFVGPSGCGKTTSLRLIAGLEDATEGTIRIGDQVVNNIPPRDRDIAMVFQNYALYPHMNVFDNMAFGLRMRRVPRAEIKKKVSEAAGMLGIEHLLKRKPKALSGGERQRVAVGRAIVRHPKVFLFDEPLSNLDAKLRVQMRTEIKRIQRQLETTSVYVTHDQEEAMTLADLLVVMKSGVVQQRGTPLEVYGRPTNRFVAGFFGTPSMNFVTGIVASEGGTSCFMGGGLNVALDAQMANSLSSSGASLVLGVRAEHISIDGHTQRPASAAGSEPASQNSANEMMIETVELLGDTQNVFLEPVKPSSQPTRLVARVTSEANLSAGDRVNVSFDPSGLHFFSSDDDGRRLM